MNSARVAGSDAGFVCHVLSAERWPVDIAAESLLDFNIQNNVLSPFSCHVSE